MVYNFAVEGFIECLAVNIIGTRIIHNLSRFEVNIYLNRGPNQKFSNLSMLVQSDIQDRDFTYLIFLKFR